MLTDNFSFVKILIVEDHLMMRELLRKACTETFGHQLVGETGDGRDAFALYSHTRPDLVLLDLQLPGISGFQILEELQQKAPRLKILILSSCCDEYTIFRVERSNIQGFIDKDTGSVHALGRALESISNGGTFFSEQFVRLSKDRHRNQTSFDKILTNRELTILIMLSQSPSDALVANRLGIAKETVEKHRSNIFKKLELHTMAELVRYASEKGFAQFTAAKVSQI